MKRNCLVGAQLVILLVFVFLRALPVQQKILIMTPTSNHPEYIALQAQGFKKFLKDPYEFMVFNDASNETDRKAIDAMCASLAITCVRVPQENRKIGTVFSWASYRHGQAINYLMQQVGIKYDGVAVLIDSDLFLIKEFSIHSFFNGYDLAGVRQGELGSRTEYIWPGLLFLRMNKLPDKETMRFAPEETPAGKRGVDTAGSLYHYLNAHPTIRRLRFKQGERLMLDAKFHPYYFTAIPHRAIYIKCAACQKQALDTACFHCRKMYKELGFRQEIIELITARQVPACTEFLEGDTFFHVVGSSGYMQEEKEEIRMKYELVVAFLERMVS